MKKGWALKAPKLTELEFRVAESKPLHVHQVVNVSVQVAILYILLHIPQRLMIMAETIQVNCNPEIFLRFLCLVFNFQEAPADTEIFSSSFRFFECASNSCSCLWLGSCALVEQKQNDTQNKIRTERASIFAHACWRNVLALWKPWQPSRSPPP